MYHRFIPYIAKTLWRHRARTIVTLGGSAVGLFLFCFVASILEGLDQMSTNQRSKTALVVFQANKFCPATSHLPQDYELKIKKLPGVINVLPIQVFTNNCRASLDVIVFYGVPADRLATARDMRVVHGSMSDFANRSDGALVGAATAKRRGLEPGDKFSIGELTVVIGGVFESDDPNEENYIYAHLDFLQRNKSQNLVGTVTQFEVLCREDVDLEQLCTTIDDTFRGGPAQTDTRPKGVFQAHALGDLMQVIQLSQWLGFASVAMVLVLVATTTVMSVQDRLQEYAVLQTIGVSHRQVFGLVVGESFVLGTLGGVIGVASAMVILYWSQLSVGAEAVTIAFRPTADLAWRGVLISAGAALVAGTVPAFFAANTKIVPALRSM